MPPNQSIPAIHTSGSDAVLPRLLGVMSIFTMLMTIPQVLTIWVGRQAAGVRCYLGARVLPLLFSGSGSGYRNTTETFTCHA
jgi:hypothetical protein